MKKLLLIGLSFIFLSTSLFAWTVHTKEKNGEFTYFSLFCDDGSASSITSFDGMYIGTRNGSISSRNFNEVAAHVCGE